MATDPRSNSRRSIALLLAVGAGVYLIAKSIVGVAQAQKRRSQTPHVSKPSRQPSVQVRELGARVEMPDVGPIANDGGAPHKTTPRSNPNFDRWDAERKPSYDTPAFMCDLAEQSIDHVQSAANTFIDSARKAAQNLRDLEVTIQIPTNVALVHGLNFSEQTGFAALELARNIARADDLRDVVQLQADYAQAQFNIWQAEIGCLSGFTKKTKP